MAQRLLQGRRGDDDLRVLVVGDSSLAFTVQLAHALDETYIVCAVRDVAEGPCSPAEAQLRNLGVDIVRDVEPSDLRASLPDSMLLPYDLIIYDGCGSDRGGPTLNLAELDTRVLLWRFLRSASTLLAAPDSEVHVLCALAHPGSAICVPSLAQARTGLHFHDTSASRGSLPLPPGTWSHRFRPRAPPPSRGAASTPGCSLCGLRSASDAALAAHLCTSRHARAVEVEERWTAWVYAELQREASARVARVRSSGGAGRGPAKRTADGVARDLARYVSQPMSAVEDRDDRDDCTVAEEGSAVSTRTWGPGGEEEEWARVDLMLRAEDAHLARLASSKELVTQSWQNRAQRQRRLQQAQPSAKRTAGPTRTPDTGPPRSPAPRDPAARQGRGAPPGPSLLPCQLSGVREVSPVVPIDHTELEGPGRAGFQRFVARSGGSLGSQASQSVADVVAEVSAEVSVAVGGLGGAEPEVSSAGRSGERLGPQELPALVVARATRRSLLRDMEEAAVMEESIVTPTPAGAAPRPAAAWTPASAPVPVPGPAAARPGRDEEEAAKETWPGGSPPEGGAGGVRDSRDVGRAGPAWPPSSPKSLGFAEDISAVEDCEVGVAALEQVDAEGGEAAVVDDGAGGAGEGGRAVDAEVRAEAEMSGNVGEEPPAWSRAVEADGDRWAVAETGASVGDAAWAPSTLRETASREGGVNARQGDAQVAPFSGEVPAESDAGVVEGRRATVGVDHVSGAGAAMPGDARGPTKPTAESRAERTPVYEPVVLCERSESMDMPSSRRVPAGPVPCPSEGASGGERGYSDAGVLAVGAPPGIEPEEEHFWAGFASGAVAVVTAVVVTSALGLPGSPLALLRGAVTWWRHHGVLMLA